MALGVKGLGGLGFFFYRTCLGWGLGLRGLRLEAQSGWGLGLGVLGFKGVGGGLGL